ncbi:hypothetical protein GIB67_032708 [Kingdonia uniflora]|uniref:KIB1-4 beta-propeller domain-containing protein n=1 Tax=Kingdonia uniflora TaxID=39325 RepID=A0A7J7MVZ2_9MAGN|nr:hypothetical protein GIB67_032708 [Kingdonia uniflora]
MVIACDIQDPKHPKVTKVAPTEACPEYLVESSGELLQVIPTTIDPEEGMFEKVIRFEVFKLDPIGPNANRVRMKNLYGRTLFVGNNHTISLSNSNFPQCKPNCIYFTDDNIAHYESEGPSDVGVFNLEEGIFEPNPVMEFKKLIPQSVWVKQMPKPLWI